MSVDNHDAPKHYGVDYLIVDYYGVIARAEKRLESILTRDDAHHGAARINYPCGVPGDY